MTIEELRAKINKINNKYLGELCGAKESATDNPEASRVVPLPGSERECFCGLAGAQCFCGKTKGGYGSGADLEQVIMLRPSASSPPEAKVAVIAAIDKETENEPGSLQVVLAIGINYGQMGNHNYLTTPVPICDKTGMRPKLQAVSQILEDKCVGCFGSKLPKNFHLVVANFFPWITQRRWGAFNSIEETLLLRCHGFNDPHALLDDLITQLDRDLICLVFHGANNAVPILGAEFVSGRSASLRGLSPRIVFCDNLAPNAGNGPSNAICLCVQKLGKAMTGDSPCDE